MCRKCLKTQISLHIYSLISIFILAWEIHKGLGCPYSVKQRLWSCCINVQPHLNGGMFCCKEAHIYGHFKPSFPVNPLIINRMLLIIINHHYNDTKLKSLSHIILTLDWIKTAIRGSNADHYRSLCLLKHLCPNMSENNYPFCK